MHSPFSRAGYSMTAFSRPGRICRLPCGAHRLADHVFSGQNTTVTVLKRRGDSHHYRFRERPAPVRVPSVYGNTGIFRYGPSPELMPKKGVTSSPAHRHHKVWRRSGRTSAPEGMFRYTCYSCPEKRRSGHPNRLFPFRIKTPSIAARSQGRVWPRPRQAAVRLPPMRP